MPEYRRGVSNAREHTPAVRDGREGPAITPARARVSGMLALQRSAGNAAVARALQRVGGWTGKDISTRSPNAAERTVTDKASGKSARRIPIEGIPQGTTMDDAKQTALTTVPDKTKPKETVDHPVAEYTRESSAGGRAIVVIPTGMKLDKDATVDVLLHLHGHTLGYRSNSGQTRDLGIEDIEEQVASSHHPLIAVLPQGGFSSWFGKDAHQSFDPTPYLNAVWEILTKLNAWTGAASDPPKRGGLILSGHSGADAPIESMLAAGEKSGPGEVADLKALFLLDTMYGPKDADKMITFIKFRLARDIAQLTLLKSEKEKIDWVHANGFRVVAKHSGGHYKPMMKQVADAVAAWLADGETIKVLGAPGTALSDAVAANLVMDPATGSGKDHDSFVGDKGHLRTALDTLPATAP
jgi:hypothetical protein